MKNLYMIGGTMGVGKTTICQKLKQKLNNCVFLDGDWCWDSDPFQVTDETKNMVLNNICFLLNQYIKCSAYENIVFCWVMHEQDIINDILNNIDTNNCNIKNISLICDKEILRIRLMKDVEDGIRKEDVIERSINRISLYDNLNTLKINTNNKSIDSIVDEIISLNINTRVKK